MKQKINSVDFIDAVVAMLAEGPKTCAEMSTPLGICVKEVATIMTYCQAHRIAEKAGYINLLKRHGIVLWQLYAGKTETESKPKRQSDPATPQLVYRSPLAEFLGEPAVGRSALDQRGSRAQQ